MASYTFENEANEYANQYTAEHGGSYTKNQIISAFLRGANGLKLNDDNYHAFKAYQQGAKFGGY